MSPGGVVINRTVSNARFERQKAKLSPELRKALNKAIEDLKANLDIPRLNFEKLKGYRNPSVYTIHVTTNHSHKLSFEIEGDTAYLRNIAPHRKIDRSP